MAKNQLFENGVLIWEEEVPDFPEEKETKIDLKNIDLDSLSNEQLQQLADKIKPFIK